MVGINNPLKLSWQASRAILLCVLSSLWMVGINNPLKAAKFRNYSTSEAHVCLSRVASGMSKTYF
jgi:hypothetical protein